MRDPSRLNECPLDLTDVDGWVDAGSEIHEDVCPHHLHVAGEAVHLHLARSNALVRGATNNPYNDRVKDNSRWTTKKLANLNSPPRPHNVRVTP